MKKLFLILLLISFKVFATPPITEKVLNIEQADELGFKIKFRDSTSNGNTILSIIAPSTLGENCEPGQVGRWLFDSNNVLIDSSLVSFKGSKSEHGIRSSNVYFDNGNKIQVFFDYYCNIPSNSRRYILKFKDRKLITSQSTRTPNR